MPELSPQLLSLAGMALAHAVWSIEDGETPCTLSLLQEGEERTLTRYEADTIPLSIEYALDDLKGFRPDTFAALVCDGFYTDNDQMRHDALIVELLMGNPAGSTNSASSVGRAVQRYLPGRRSKLPFGKRSRVTLHGRTLLFGDATPESVDLLIGGACEHEKVRDLFATLPAA